MAAPVDRGGALLLRGTNPRFLTVIGVVGDVSDVGFSQPPAPTVYVTFDQNNAASTPVSLVVRTLGAQRALTNALRATLLLLLGGIGLALADLGIYGITSRAVEDERQNWACAWHWAPPPSR